MFLSQKEIIIISVVISTILVILFERIKNMFFKFQYFKRAKRAKYIKQLVKENKISNKIINVKTESHRLKQPKNNIGIIVDNVLFDNKNSYFLLEKDRICIIGKKEDFYIGLVGDFLNKPLK